VRINSTTTIKSAIINSTVFKTILASRLRGLFLIVG